MDWQPIDTAPKDGSAILLWFPKATQPCKVSSWSHTQTIVNGKLVRESADWVVTDTWPLFTDRGEPTFWMPIIAPDAGMAGVFGDVP